MSNSGYIVFRGKSSRIQLQDGTATVQIDNKVAKLTGLGGLPLRESDLLKNGPLNLSVDDVQYLVDFVCPNPLAVVEYKRTNLFKESAEKDWKLEYLQEGGKTYKVISKADSCFWYWDGRLHREDDKPAVKLGESYSAWYCEGKLHRYNGPAVVSLKEGFSFFNHGNKLGTQVVSEGRYEAMSLFIEADQEDEDLDDPDTPNENPAFVKPKKPQGMNPNNKPQQKDLGQPRYPRSSVRRALLTQSKKPLPNNV